MGKVLAKKYFSSILLSLTDRQVHVMCLGLSGFTYLFHSQHRGMLQISKSFYPTSLGPKEKLGKATKKQLLLNKAINRLLTINS